jgi:hypothetical protein
MKFDTVSSPAPTIFVTDAPPIKYKLSIYFVANAC